MFDVCDGCGDGDLNTTQSPPKVSSGSSISTLHTSVLRMALPGTTRPLASLMLPCATVHPKPAAESTKTMLSTKEPTEKLHSAPKELLLKLKEEHSHGGSEREEVENDRLRTLPAHESDQSTHFDGLGRLALKIPAEMLATHSPLKRRSNGLRWQAQAAFACRHTSDANSQRSRSCGCHCVGRGGNFYLDRTRPCSAAPRRRAACKSLDRG